MSDRAAEAVFVSLLLILPLAGLIARRPPLRQTMLFAGGWVAIFLISLTVVGYGERLLPMRTGATVEGRETRIAMAADGHFWVDVTIDGARRRMLVDSGATTTAITQATADAARLERDSPFPIVLDTANGSITATTATARQIDVGDLTTRGLTVAVSPRFGDTDVLGMNFLSRLRSWRVEGRTLVLVPFNR